jgi:hypothetical protein
METAYFTSADAEVRLLNHPDERWRGSPVDAASYSISSGRNPIHVWNYAYRDATPRDEGVSGDQGGSPFDDTALSNAMTTLQLVMNAKVFRDVRYQFAVHTYIGDVQIRYKGVSGWTPTQADVAGYVLQEGYVAQAGSEVTVGGSTYPTITIQFKTLRTLGEGPTTLFGQTRPQLTPAEAAAEAARQAVAEGATPEEAAEAATRATVGTAGLRDYQVYDALVETPSGPSVYDPVTMETLTELGLGLTLSTRVTGGQTLQASLAGSFEGWVRTQPFRGALIENAPSDAPDAPGPRGLWVWDRAVSRYKALETRAGSTTRILTDYALTSAQHAAAAAALL